MNRAGHPSGGSSAFHFKRNGMNRLILMILLLSSFMNASKGQITISPEIGISYLPFTLYGANTENSSNRIDYILGISGSVPVHEKWHINTRISYVDREDIKWTDLCTCPGYQYTQYSHSDLNIDFSANYQLYKWLYIGGGPSIIRKFNSSLLHKNIMEGDVRKNQDEFEFAANVLLSIKFFRFTIKAEYARKLQGYTVDWAGPSFKPLGKNRYNLLLSYSILTGGENR